MTSLWLIVPAHQRHDIAALSFKGLAWTRHQLANRNINCRILVITDEHDLTKLARRHNFDTTNISNLPLGRKWNTGYEYAGRRGADYIAPCGSDDWIHPDYLADLPNKPNEIRASRRSIIVREDGRELADIEITYDGGDGIRIIPAPLLAPCGYRPAQEIKERAIDTSVWMTLRRTAPGFTFRYTSDPYSIVEFKSAYPQLNSYDACVRGLRCIRHDNPFDLLRERYPDFLVDAAEQLAKTRR